MSNATLRIAERPSEIDAFRTLCRAYAASLPFSLDYQGFEAEMASLPGKYAPPRGALFVAWDGGAPVGIVAVRALPEDSLVPTDPGERSAIAELKRMYVDPAARGRGIGRLLGEAAVEFARRAGYRAIWLDSEPDFAAALAVYRALGFGPIERYNRDPQESTVYLGLTLR